MSKKYVAKISITILLLVVALIPFWLFIGGRSLSSPEGFFQNFFIFGLGAWFLGCTQLVLLIIWFGVIYSMWKYNF